MKNIYVFKFQREADAVQSELNMVPSVIAAESLYGKGAVRLGLQYTLCRQKNAMVIKSVNEAAEAVVRIFTNYAIKVFGEQSFTVEQKEAVADKA